jgi:hypothetical protein
VGAGYCKQSWCIHTSTIPDHQHPLTGYLVQKR